MAKSEFKQLSFKQWLMISWSFSWRLGLTSFIASILGGIFEVIIGIVLNKGSLSDVVIFHIGIFGIQMIIGFLAYIFTLNWFFKMSFKDFRITLTSLDSREPILDSQPLPLLDWIPLLWAIFWRSTILTIGFLPVLLLLVFGFIYFIENLNISTIFVGIVFAVIFIIISILASVILLKWFLQTRFKKYQITLIKNDQKLPLNRGTEL